MVCQRCKAAVSQLLQELHIPVQSVELGEVQLQQELTADQLLKLKTSLEALGFELLDDKKSKAIEKIKTAIVELVHHSDGELKTNLSEYISSLLHQDYNYLSNLFSATEGTTIEKYFIAQRIEKAKELLLYDELSLSQIADRLGYSSVAYLSNQFKKVTGLTPTYFKSLKTSQRKNLDNL